MTAQGKTAVTPMITSAVIYSILGALGVVIFPGDPAAILAVAFVAAVWGSVAVLLRETRRRDTAARRRAHQLVHATGETATLHQDAAGDWWVMHDGIMTLLKRSSIRRSVFAVERLHGRLVPYVPHIETEAAFAGSVTGRHHIRELWIPPQDTTRKDTA